MDDLSVNVVTRDKSLSHSTDLSENYMFVDINDIRSKVLVDRGSSISVISIDALRQLLGSKQPCLLASEYKLARGFASDSIPVLGRYNLQVYINGLTVDFSFHVFEKLNTDILVGLDFLKYTKADINFAASRIAFFEGMLSLDLSSKKKSGGFVKAVAGVNFVVKPNHEALLPVVINNVDLLKGGDCVIFDPKPQTSSILGSRSIGKLFDGNKSLMTLVNLSNEPKLIKKGSCLAYVESINSKDISCVDDGTYGYLDGGPQSRSTEHSHLMHTNHVGSHDNGMVTSVNELSVDYSVDDKLIQIAEEMGVKLDSSDLSDHERQIVLSFLGRNRDIFITKTRELGHYTGYKCVIDTGDAPPVNKRAYRCSPKARKEIERQVEELLDNNIIEPSESSWSSPVVLVEKPDKSYRLCIDFREVNKITKPMQWLLPTLDDVKDCFIESRPRYFSSLDLTSAFWQIALHPDSMEKTTFTTHIGNYQFKRLTFGLKNASFVFQKVLSTVLRLYNTKFLVVYIDDILCYSHSFSEHLNHLSLIFDKLRAANLKLKPSKYDFFRSKIKFLGLIFSHEGISADPAKIEAMATFPSPLKDVKAVFFGLGNWYRTFIKDYALIVTPLNKLLRKGVVFQWKEDQEQAFSKIKSLMTNPPVLMYPDLNKEFIVTCDGSTEAIGYILGQKNDQGREHVIAYGGRSLNVHEQKYSVQDIEMLCLIEAIKTFHPYVANNKIQVYKDHLSQRIFFTYLNELSTSMEEAREIAEANVSQAQDVYKQAYDKRSLNDRKFQLGDKVLIRTMKRKKGESPKFIRPYGGPFYITLIGLNDTYRLRECETNRMIKSMIHADRLTAYHDPVKKKVTLNTSATLEDIASSGQKQDGGVDELANGSVFDAVGNDTAASDLSQGDTWYEAVKLSGIKRKGRQVFYKVCWKNGHKPTWEESEDISDKLKQIYHINRTLTGAKRKRINKS